MRYCLAILILCILLSACNMPYTDASSVRVVDRNLREASFTECMHSNKDLDIIMADYYAFDNLKMSCRYAAYVKATIYTTYGEYKKHPEWELQ